MLSNNKNAKFRMDTGMDAFQSLTGKARSYRTETEHERTSASNAGGENWGTSFQNQMNDLLVDDVMQMAINDKFKEGEKQMGGRNAEDEGEGEAGNKAGKEEHEDEHDGKNMEEDDLEAIRKRRLDKMREQHKKKMEYQAQGHGEYTEIKEDEFLGVVILRVARLWTCISEKWRRSSTEPSSSI
ncbi:unnamed protein product [Amoebophrya sp. A25]|nr:unnamed protein product [Amoebophrya sp. A25]|eukprot:GSA25T00007776001.1